MNIQTGFQHYPLFCIGFQSTFSTSYVLGITQYVLGNTLQGFSIAWKFSNAWKGAGPFLFYSLSYRCINYEQFKRQKNGTCKMRVTLQAMTLLIMLVWINAFSTDLPVEEAVPSPPPLVPPTIERNHPAKVIVRIEAVEKVMPMTDGVDYILSGFSSVETASNQLGNENQKVNLAPR